MRARDLADLLTPAVLLLGLVWLATSALAAGDKVTICHIPPGNPENVQIIDVSTFAPQKHIDRHGDLIFDGAGEVCDRQDNGSNREVDEGFADLGLACSDGVGECKSDGAKVCSQDGSSTACWAVAGDPTVERCRGGLDGDRDTDEDEFLNATCHRSINKTTGLLDARVSGRQVKRGA